MADQVYQVVFSTRDVDGLTAQNVFHAQMDDSTFTDYFAATQALLAGVQALLAGDYEAMISEGCTLLGILARRITNGGGSTASLVLNVPGAWSGVHDIATSGVCAVMRYITAGTDHDGGRSFFPCVPKDALTDNVYASGYITAVNKFAADLVTGGAAGSIPFFFGAWVRKTHTFVPYVAYQLNAKPGSLNKRLKPFIM